MGQSEKKSLKSFIDFQNSSARSVRKNVLLNFNFGREITKKFNIARKCQNQGHWLYFWFSALDPPIDIEQAWPWGWWWGRDERLIVCSLISDTQTPRSHLTGHIVWGSGHMNIQTPDTLVTSTRVPASHARVALPLHATQCRIKCLGLNHQKSRE